MKERIWIEVFKRYQDKKDAKIFLAYYDINQVFDKFICVISQSNFIYIPEYKL